MKKNCQNNTCENWQNSKFFTEKKVDKVEIMTCARGQKNNSEWIKLISHSSVDHQQCVSSFNVNCDRKNNFPMENIKSFKSLS